FSAEGSSSSRSSKRPGRPRRPRSPRCWKDIPRRTRPSRISSVCLKTERSSFAGQVPDDTMWSKGISMQLRRFFGRTARAREQAYASQRAGNATTDGLSYNKICNIEDFEHPRLRGLIREIFPHEISRFGPDFPRGREYRKHWEVAMAARSLADHGVLHERARVLGVAAGNEPTIFWLTTQVERVFATDLYFDAGGWSPFA